MCLVGFRLCACSPSLNGQGGWKLHKILGTTPGFNCQCLRVMEPTAGEGNLAGFGSSSLLGGRGCSSEDNLNDAYDLICAMIELQLRRRLQAL